jgi:uncharacterized membrane protein
MRLREKKWFIEVFHLIFPCIFGIGVIALVGYFFVYDMQAKYWVLVASYFFPPFGKETIIPIGIFGGELPIPFSNQIAIISPIHPMVMALSIAFVDFIVALFLVWNYDLAKSIPIIGNFIKKVESIGKTSSSKYHWIKPLRFVGIMLFVMVPFQGSGGLVGSIIGRLIGMKPWNTLLAITFGAIIGCIIIAYFAEVIKSVLIQNFLIGVLIIFILLIIGVMIFVYKKNNTKKRNK